MPWPSMGAELVIDEADDDVRERVKKNARFSNYTKAGGAGTLEGLAEDGSNKPCYDPEYVQDICHLHPINLVKTVRMRTRQVAPLLDEPGTQGLRNHSGEDDLCSKLLHFRSEC